MLDYRFHYCLSLQITVIDGVGRKLIYEVFLGSKQRIRCG